jgi:hypothetical protein
VNELTTVPGNWASGSFKDSGEPICSLLAAESISRTLVDDTAMRSSCILEAESMVPGVLPPARTSDRCQLTRFHFVGERIIAISGQSLPIFIQLVRSFVISARILMRRMADPEEWIVGMSGAASRMGAYKADLCGERVVHRTQAMGVSNLRPGIPGETPAAAFRMAGPVFCA